MEPYVTSITIVQQGVWHMAKESMPLAAGYLAGCIRADEHLTGREDRPRLGRLRDRRVGRQQHPREAARHSPI
jgi:hypothetical protein